MTNISISIKYIFNYTQIKSKTKKQKIRESEKCKSLNLYDLTQLIILKGYKIYKRTNT